MEYELVLTHHGIKGQKWGVRRFQKKDGSLTAAGRKRYGDDNDNKKNYSGVHEDYIRAHTKRSVESMSDEELRAVNARLAQEQNYYKYNPKKKSLGKKLMDNFIVPAATDIAKSYVKKYMGEGAAYLEKTLKNKSEDSSSNETPSNDTSTSSGKTGKKGMKWETRTKTEKESYDGPIDIGGEGTSHRKTKDDGRNSKNYDTSKIYTDDWEEVRDTYSSPGKSFVSNLPSISDTVNVFKGLGSKMSNYAPQASLGQAFISGFLEPPKS